MCVSNWQISTFFSKATSLLVVEYNKRPEKWTKKSPPMMSVSSDWKKASPQILIIFSLFCFLSLSVFWASMLTLTVRLPRVQESWHLSQDNYLRFMYCHWDAGRFECLRIQFGTTDQNCKQMSLHASLCFSCTSDLCLWWHYTSKLEPFQLQHECSHRYIRSQCHTLNREKKCLYSYTYSAFIHEASEVLLQWSVPQHRSGTTPKTLW